MGNFTLGASISKISTLVSQVGLTTLARAGNGSSRTYRGYPGASGGLPGPVKGSNAQKSLYIDMYINSILLSAVELNMALIFYTSNKLFQVFS